MIQLFIIANLTTLFRTVSTDNHCRLHAQSSVWLLIACLENQDKFLMYLLIRLKQFKISNFYLVKIIFIEIL